MILSIDFETYSDIDIGEAGLYHYVESPVFEILLIAYAFDDAEPTVIDMTALSEDEKEQVKQQFKAWLSDPDITIHAYNAEFEIEVFSTWFGYRIPLDNWRDTMVTALTCGLPRALKDVGIALGMPEEDSKLREGKALVKYFCTPCEPKKSNGFRTRNTRLTDHEKWEKFIEYNRQDVVAERAIWKKVRHYEPDVEEHRNWMFSVEINRRGVLIDRKMAENAVRLSDEFIAKPMAELKQITGLENPNSRAQLTAWLGMDSLTKEAVGDALKTASGDTKRVLELRQLIGKTSVVKYKAMINSMCSDDRIRGAFVFYGANRTGRYSGRFVQPQNLPQNHLDDLTTARDCVLQGDLETFELLYDNVPDTLSQLIRTTLIPKPGHIFAVADFSAIEARLLAWVAGEKWAMQAFAAGKDIYCETASQMFHVPVQKHGVNGHLRQKGKQAVLGCGYGSNIQGLIKMGAVKNGIPEEELPSIIEMWREANPHIVRFWSKIGNAMTAAVKNRVVTDMQYGISVFRTGKLLHVRLPSGRCIRYYDPKIGTNKWGNESLEYQAYDAGKWLKADTWGGKATENLIQAIGRDCLLVAMRRVAERYPEIVMHVHDEMIVEVPEDEAQEALKYICDCMAQPIAWAPGLILRGDGYLTEFYRKD